MSSTSDEIFKEMAAGFGEASKGKRRRFCAALLISFIDFYIELGVPGLGLGSFAGLLERFPKRDTTSGGRRANTLIVGREDGKTLSLRGFYNEAERYFRDVHKRYDYPSCAPHATQMWPDYTTWLDRLTTLSLLELEELSARVKRFVLDALPSQEFLPGSVLVDPPFFRLLLEGFDFAVSPGVASGASFQGAVFGYLRADNPHLQVEIAKVRTGSKRLQRVGDIDAWDGERLAITAEVKSLKVEADLVGHLSNFANEVQKRGAIGILAALDFAADAREETVARGLIALDKEQMITSVGLWDPTKQRIAVTSMLYYARHVEKSAALSESLNSFVSKIKNSEKP